MKFRIRSLALGLVLTPVMGWAQDPHLVLPDFKPLADKAVDSVNISLSPWLLRAMSSFIDKDDSDDAAVKELLAGIRTIEVRSYQFKNDFEYSAADIDSVRKQLSGPGWTRLVQVNDRKQGEKVDVYMLIEGDHTKGFALIASEPREFTIVNIVGSLRLEDLPKLEGQLHLKNLRISQDTLRYLPPPI